MNTQPKTELNNSVFIQKRCNLNGALVVDSEGGIAFLAPSAGITDAEQIQSTTQSFVMMLKWWGPTGYRAHSA